jgi:hypothetical protein
VELERSFVHDAHWPGAYHALLEHTARLLHAPGDVQGAIALLMRDHCNEPAARLLTACYDAQGERAAAARVYHTLRVRLQDELLLLPGPRTEELALRVHPSRRCDAHGTRTVLSTQRRRQPRPTELNPPVGREEELARAEYVLDDVWQHAGVYALFVQEEAGVGKTYVAHEILNRARQRGFTVPGWDSRQASSEVLLSLRGKKMYSAVTNMESMCTREYTSDKRPHRTRQ